MNRKPSSWVFDIILSFSDLFPVVLGAGTIVFLACNFHKVAPLLHQFVQHK
jgi:hypothetical protein